MEKFDKNITKYLLLGIAILIITLFVYPIYISTKQETSKKKFTNQVNNIITNVKKYYISNNQVTSNVKVFNIKNGKIMEDGFEYNGELPNEGKIYINQNGEVQIVASNGTWCATKRYSDDSLNVSSTSSNCKIIESISFGGISVALSNEGDGLYQSDDEYSYRGSNPDNYFLIGKTLFRIISIDVNGNIKLISNSILYNSSWNIKSLTNNDFRILDNDNIAYYLNYADTTNLDINEIRTSSNILEYTWNISKFSYVSDKLYYELKQKNNEYKSVNAVVGLPTASEYIRASLDESCMTDALRNNKCGNNNYLNIKQDFFTISISNDAVWAVSSEGKLYETTLNLNLGVRPTIVISSNVKISGKGTKEAPFKIEKTN